MSTIKCDFKILCLQTEENTDRYSPQPYPETGLLEVTGTGKLVIVDTGGSSASEGGMGSGSDDDTEKGSLSKPGEKSGQASSNEDDDTTFDPLKKSIKEAEKARDKD